MRELTRVAVMLTAIVCLASACATRSWVREAMGKQETEIGQRINLVDGRVSEESQRVGQRIEGMDTRVNTVEGSANAAGDLARGAKVKADEVDGRLTRLWGNRYNQKVSDTFDVT